MSEFVQTPPTTGSSEVFLEWGAARLAREIAGGQVSARQVVEAFAGRIEQVDGKLNAVVVRRLEQARAEAAAADERQALRRPLGPLHGVPVTIKECFQVAGTAATLGLVNRRDQRAREDGSAVGAWRAAGAIVLGKTNVPQLMLWHETDNPLYGRTNNPWDLHRTPGGSSGGEAAIIAAGGSPLGLGSDMGGSLRVPAHFCGIHAIKPTSGRLSCGGGLHALRGMEAIGIQPGPMARRVEDLELALRLLCRSAGGPADLPHDAVPAPPPDSGGVDAGKLGVAVWNDDPCFTSSPAVHRAVEEAVRLLIEAGAERKSLRMPTSDCLPMYYGLVGADGGADARRWLRGSPRALPIRRLLRISSIPGWLRPLLARGLGWSGQVHAAQVVRAAHACSADQYWQLCHARQCLVRRFTREMARAGVDLILAPAFATPAPRHGDALDLLPAACYSFLPNLLGLPSGVVAFSQVRPGEETPRRAGRDWATRGAQRAERDSCGLPVGVQVIGRHWREDVVLAAMRHLEAGAMMRDDYPGIAEP